MDEAQYTPKIVQITVYLSENSKERKKRAPDRQTLNNGEQWNNPASYPESPKSINPGPKHTSISNHPADYYFLTKSDILTSLNISQPQRCHPNQKLFYIHQHQHLFYVMTSQSVILRSKWPLSHNNVRATNQGVPIFACPRPTGKPGSWYDVTKYQKWHFFPRVLVLRLKVVISNFIS